MNETRPHNSRIPRTVEQKTQYLCGICSEDLTIVDSRVCATACGHLFCNRCMLKKIESKKRPIKCPRCLKVVATRSLRTVYL
ncbi:hypothetical protein HUJ05_010351 [Dendroctonus ponderosae]|nr:hypothetical protein HUJ05_010351 [Dendroctonus ponderosae]